MNEVFRCRSMFFVSEIDMLKAVRTALLDEVISSAGDWLDGEKFMALYNFLGLLIKVIITFILNFEQLLLLIISKYV